MSLRRWIINSVLRPACLPGNYTVVKADKSGYVHAEDVEKAVRKDTKLIVCTHASNVCGTIQPVYEIGRIAKKHKIPFFAGRCTNGREHKY